MPPMTFGTDTGKNVLVADFLDQVEVELPVLGDHARLTLAQAWNESELAPYLADTDVMILFHDIARISDATLAAAPRLKAIVRAGVGYNNVDIEAAGKRGIVTCNVPDYGSEEVADHSIMFLLALARQLGPCDQSIRDGKWDYKVADAAPRLRGKTIGIVGCGRIGTATALRAKAFGLDVVFYDPYLPDGVDKALGIRRARTLDELLPQCQFLSLHCYLDTDSYHMIDARALAALPRGGVGAAPRKPAGGPLPGAPRSVAASHIYFVQLGTSRGADVVRLSWSYTVASATRTSSRTRSRTASPTRTRSATRSKSRSRKAKLAAVV